MKEAKEAEYDNGNRHNSVVNHILDEGSFGRKRHAKSQRESAEAISALTSLAAAGLSSLTNNVGELASRPPPPPHSSSVQGGRHARPARPATTPTATSPQRRSFTSVTTTPPARKWEVAQSKKATGASRKKAVTSPQPTVDQRTFELVHAAPFALIPKDVVNITSVIN